MKSKVPFFPKQKEVTEVMKFWYRIDLFLHKRYVQRKLRTINIDRYERKLERFLSLKD